MQTGAKCLSAGAPSPWENLDLTTLRGFASSAPLESPRCPALTCAVLVVRSECLAL